MDYLYISLSAVTPENHPRTAKLLASSTRKTAQKVIEEAGEVALAAVKHQTRGIINESADLLYHLVALWHRAGINPDQVWTEMRRRSAALGIAEKLPKPHHQQLVPKAEIQSIRHKNGSRSAMTEISGIGGRTVRTRTAGSPQTPLLSYGVFKPVFRGAGGPVRESASLVINVAGPGVTSSSENTAVQPTRQNSHKVQARARRGTSIRISRKHKPNSR